MYAWEAIQSAVNTIEDHLSEELSIEALAKGAALSPFYFQRLFSRLVKKPVREYIRLRRLAAASGLLAHTGKRILDVALETGFSSHESLTRAFKQAYGITPEAFRKHPVLLNQFDKPDLLLHYVMVDEGVPLITDGLVLEYNRKRLAQPVRFLGLTGTVPIEGQMPLGEGTGVDIPGEVWMRFHSQKAALPRTPGGREVGVAYLQGAPAGSFIYFAGAEVPAGAEIPAGGFTEWQLPAREYIVCGFEAEDFETLVTVALNKAVKYSMSWLDNHGYTSEEYAPEVYYPGTPEASYMELWTPFIESP